MSHHKPDPNKNINLTIDGLPVTVPEGTRILEAARKVNCRIPTLCDHPDLGKRAVCRVCVVECDGRGKLAAACANDVAEGMKVVTHNARLTLIRKTIVELILADHPQECLTCIRSKKCELQSLAEQLGIRESAFRHEAQRSGQPVTESLTLTRDMGKCVKCGRCVEACQEVQNIRAINGSCRSIHYEISAPYGQSLTDGQCVFCGQCARVCPVGAIYEHDQSGAAWAALAGGGETAARIDPAIGAAFDEALGLPSGTVSGEKLVTALKRLGFGKVYDANFSASTAAAAICEELLRRIGQGRQPEKPQLPLITGCWGGLSKFVENCGGDLAALVYQWDSKAHGCENTVAISPCLAKKYNAPEMTLTVREIARMFTLAGIELSSLSESPFDEAAGKSGEAPKLADFHPAEGMDGVEKAQVSFMGSTLQLLTVHGLANARKMLDFIRKGECKAAFVEILCCPDNSGGCGSIGAYLPEILHKNG